MNFGPEEIATYEIKEIWEAVKNKVVTPNEARHILSKYHKWDINGEIKGGEVPLEPKALPLKEKGKVSTDKPTGDKE